MDSFDVVVVGGGQAGLGMGWRLGQAGVSFVIVDERSRAGDVWRDRWDSLTLFTPRPFIGLPGMKAPRHISYYPTGAQMADYLEHYRDEFDLPVEHGFAVQNLSRRDGVFSISSATETLRAHAVVIAAGPFHMPYIPDCARRLGSDVTQLHSSDYRSPSDVPPGRVLVVGGGNSAAQLSEELARDHDVTIATGGPIAFAPRKILGASLFWFMHFTGVLRADKDARISRYARPYSDTVIGFGLKKLISTGAVRHIEHRVTDCADDEIVFGDGSRERFDTVLWCTGFRSHYPWLKIDDALTDDGEPHQDCGISPVPGLYWLGLPWQRRLNSALVNGVSSDTAFLVPHITQHLDNAS